jgi:hypothetical protein
MFLKGALHVHSTCSDGELTIPELAEVYARLGFDFFAVTDHDFLLRAGCYEKQLGSLKTDLLVFSGLELTVFEKGYLHVNRVQGDDEVLHFFNHPAELDLPFDKVCDRIAVVAGRLPLDAVEVTSKGFYTPEYDVPEIPYPKLATDDAHTREACGRAWIEMDCKRDKDSIIRAIKRGDHWNCFQKGR